MSIGKAIKYLYHICLDKHTIQITLYFTKSHLICHQCASFVPHNELHCISLEGSKLMQYAVRNVSLQGKEGFLWVPLASALSELVLSLILKLGGIQRKTRQWFYIMPV